MQPVSLRAGEYGPLCTECKTVLNPNAKNLWKHFKREHARSVSLEALSSFVDSHEFRVPQVGEVHGSDPLLPVREGISCENCGSVFLTQPSFRKHSRREHNGEGISVSVYVQPSRDQRYHRVDGQREPNNDVTLSRRTKKRGTLLEGGPLRFPPLMERPSRSDEHLTSLIPQDCNFSSVYVDFYKSIGFAISEGNRFSYVGWNPEKLKSLARKVDRFDTTKHASSKIWLWTCILVSCGAVAVSISTSSVG
eukprot:gb/GECG01011532.1/.p1 GENE.gb/GECG01011532.1/~~gb/GECG01011532.1/.p1  ORF type:complete len:250 (+),score=13.93 gb/GECG01011532.1/:1-750(+)